MIDKFYNWSSHAPNPQNFDEMYNSMFGNGYHKYNEKLFAWTNAGILLIGHLGTYFSTIVIIIKPF